jgi:AcrR family transcriptional regulator
MAMTDRAPTQHEQSRQPRADARRNRDALIAAAETLFAEQGADLPFEEVARAAGVGKGTLYRHFATKDHLVAAIFQERFVRLAEAADALFIEEGPLDAVEHWLRDFDRHPVKSRGLSARVGESLADTGSAVSTACAPMKSSFARLLDRAKESGEIRADVTAPELLTVVAALPERFRNADGSSPFLETILRGLRA